VTEMKLAESLIDNAFSSAKWIIGMYVFGAVADDVLRNRPTAT
jgi:hypothetical protein